jgi:hypothetical protein
MANIALVPTPPSRPDGSLTSYEPKNVKLVLEERLLPSEAAELVAAILRSYPPNDIEQSGYIITLAACLQQFPKAVAIRCGNPLKGVAATTRFRPTVADITAWCQREVDHLQEIVDRADHEKRLTDERIARIFEEQRLAEERKSRPSMEELRTKYGPTWGLKKL